MAGVVTNGIDSITIDSSVLGLTAEDSFAFNIDDQTSEQTFNVEETDEPLFTIKTGSKILGFSFVIADPDETAIKTLFDGEDIGGTPGSGVEIDGISNVLKKKEVVITAKQGWKITLTSADIDAAPDTDLGKNSLFGIVVNVKQNGGTIKFEEVDND